MADPDWHLWRSFLAVLRGGSLSEAARRLRATQPTLGRHVAELEAALGQTLFTRANDGLRPTDAALALAPHAEAMASAAAMLLRAASAPADALSGTVRLAASVFMGGAVLPPMLARFAERHPAVAIELAVSDRIEDLLRRDADLAVRNVQPTQAALVVRRIGEVPICFFAHRRYVAAHGMPETLDDLFRHRVLGAPEHVAQATALLVGEPRFAFRCAEPWPLLTALRAGMGIGYCQAAIGRADPDLVPVLPEVVVARIGIWLAMHEDLRATARVRTLFDHLAAELTAYVSAP